MLLPTRHPLIILPFIVCLSWLLVWYHLDDIELWRLPHIHLHDGDSSQATDLPTVASESNSASSPSPHPTLKPISPSASSNNSKTSRELFIETAVATLPEGEFDGLAISKVCNKTETWDSSLTFDCLGVEGGIGNVKQIFLSCLRYAIDAGAGLIMPQINTRDETDLISLESGKADISYLFDQDQMVSRLRTSCPQMPIYENRAELEKTGPISAVIQVDPRRMTPPDDTGKQVPHVVSVKEYPDLQGHLTPAGENTVVEFLITLAYFQVCFDNTAFVNTFGQILPFRKDVERLAATALYELSHRYNLSVDPAQPIVKDAYLGVHLRTDADAVKMGWPTYEENSARFLSLAANTSLPVMYVASGDATAIETLAREASLLKPPVPVVTKNDLLDEADISLLKSLSWDQQALVDYLMLLKASYFGGMTESSFSWNIAVRRRILSRVGTCGTPNHWRRPENTVLKDEFTDLLGSHDSDWEAHMWP